MSKSTRKYYTVVMASHVIFERDGKVLLSRRYNTGYRDGEYSLPAGHIEEGEFATQAALREAHEEVGVVVKPEDLLPAHITHLHRGDHERIAFFFSAKQWDGEPINMEPEKCDEIRWVDVNQLPSNTVPYVRAALEHYFAGCFFSEFVEPGGNIFK